MTICDQVVNESGAETPADGLWLELLRKEAMETSIGRAALKVGYSRTAISQALDGKYPGDLRKMQMKVLAALQLPMKVECPHLRINLPTDMCNDFSTRPAPTHHPFGMQLWRACQQCPNRAEKVVKKS